MVDRTLPMPTAEAAEQAASACLLIGLALRSGSLKKRYQLLKAAQVFVEQPELEAWLDEIAAYRGKDALPPASGNDMSYQNTPGGAIRMAAESRSPSIRG